MQTILVLSCIPYGAGMHIWDLPPHINSAPILRVSQTLYKSLDFSKLTCGQVSYVLQILYPLSVTAIKLSILLLYLRLFPLMKFRRCVKSLMVVFGFIGAVVTLVAVFQCRHVDDAWKIALPTNCVTQASMLEGQAIFNLISDVTIIVLPMPVIWRLHMPLRRRLLLLGIFTVGFM